jgi:hypothetical protein
VPARERAGGVVLNNEDARSHLASDGGLPPDRLKRVGASDIAH